IPGPLAPPISTTRNGELKVPPVWLKLPVPAPPPILGSNGGGPRPTFRPALPLRLNSPLAANWLLSPPKPPSSRCALSTPTPLRLYRPDPGKIGLLAWRSPTRTSWFTVIVPSFWLTMPSALLNPRRKVLPTVILPLKNPMPGWGLLILRKPTELSYPTMTSPPTLSALKLAMSSSLSARMLTETGLANPVPETVTTPRWPPTRWFSHTMSLDVGTPDGDQFPAEPQFPVPTFQLRSVAPQPGTATTEIRPADAANARTTWC